MKFKKITQLQEDIDSVGRFTDEFHGEAPVSYADVAVRREARYQQIADELDKHRDEAGDLDNTDASRYSHKTVSTPELKKMHLSEALKNGSLGQALYDLDKNLYYMWQSLHLTDKDNARLLRLMMDDSNDVNDVHDFLMNRFDRYSKVYSVRESLRTEGVNDGEDEFDDMYDDDEDDDDSMSKSKKKDKTPFVGEDRQDIFSEIQYVLVHSKGQGTYKALNKNDHPDYKPYITGAENGTENQFGTPNDPNDRYFIYQAWVPRSSRLNYMKAVAKLFNLKFDYKMGRNPRNPNYKAVGRIYLPQEYYDMTVPEYFEMIGKDWHDLVVDKYLTEDVEDAASFEEPKDDVLNTPNVAAPGAGSSLATSINNAIVDEFEAIQVYNDIIASIQADTDFYKDYPVEEYLNVFRDIVNEENVHVGQLQKVLKEIAPNAESIADGEKEAEEQISDTVEDVDTKVDDEEVIADIETDEGELDDETVD